ncbi:hypothetical protein [Dickeya sp. NCPPB 3274]|uniref:hypothetical protein n=1 Tax=Dickeya sp. NCPPB 3274 TaxID=568766 RepID=UPI001268AFF0|nr:hypothetical protein [Dickeya sp. NCPPB 3274]
MPSDDRSGLFSAIGSPTRPRRTVSTLSEFYLAANTDTDLYYTPNLFFDWRNARMTAGLCANYIEIDTQKILNDTERQSVISDVFSQISKKNLPLPSAVIESGSGGLHLYWVYDGVVDAYPSQQRIWKLISETLSQALIGNELWHVDFGASHDISRFLRIPGSKHSGSCNRVKVWLHDVKYDFYDLAEKLSVPVNVNVVSFKSNDSENNKVSKSDESLPPSSRHTINSWWGRIYFHLVNYIRSTGSIPNGQRDSIAFITFVALRRVTSIEKSWSMIRSINAEYIGLTEKELSRYLSTASKTTYKYKKSTLRDYFKSAGIPIPDFLTGATVTWNVSLGLSSDEIKKRQANAAFETATRRRNETRASIINAINSLTRRAMSITTAAVASVARVSQRTVQRFFCREGVNRSSCISAPPEGI